MGELQQTMRAVQLQQPGTVSVEQLAVPQPAAGEVLLRVTAAGVCQTDLHIRADPHQATPAHTVLGHEIAGEIVALGEGVQGWQAGARVVVHPCWACGHCHQCQEGRENACQGNGDRLRPPPTPGVSVNGGMAEYVRAPAAALIEIGDLDPAMAAILADAGLAPYHSVRLVREKLSSGSTAVVIGVGGLGQFAVQFLRLLTSAQVIAIDVAQEALDLVAPYTDHGLLAGDGAAQQVLALTEARGVEVVIDLVGNDQSLRLAAAILAPYGALQAIGLNAGSLPFEAGERSSVQLPWGVTLMKPYSGTYQDLRDVIALAGAGKLNATIKRFALDEAVSAFDALGAGEIRGRAVLLP